MRLVTDRPCSFGTVVGGNCISIYRWGASTEYPEHMNEVSLPLNLSCVICIGRHTQKPVKYTVHNVKIAVLLLFAVGFTGGFLA